MAKILIAEDERDIRDLVAFTLRFAGHDVVAVENGAQAVEAAGIEMPDLILMDVRMPQMTGYEACQHIKSNDRIKHIPVVFLSAKGQDSEIEAGFAAGASDYLLKPFGPMELTEKIGELLEKYRKARRIMSAILFEQGIIHYEVLGRGRPILFLHGWVGSWRYWIPVMQAASISFRTYAIDLWGFGDSAKDPRRYSFSEQLRLLDGFLDTLGIARFAVVGHGLGAILGLVYAQTHPGSVDRIMAVGYPFEESMIHSRLHSDSPAVLADWLLGRGLAAEPAWADAPKTDPLALQSSLNSLSQLNLAECWRTSQTACLMVHGQNDPAIQPPYSDHIASLPHLMHAITFDQSGHFPMLDESSKFNRLLNDFLALAPGDSPRELLLKEEWRRRVR